MHCHRGTGVDRKDTDSRTNRNVWQGFGPASRSMSPARSTVAIREGVEIAHSTARKGGLSATSDTWKQEIEFTNPVDVYSSSWYPGIDYAAPRIPRFI
ncbi:MAG: peptide transporter [Cypionkella sp.]|nr:peptide transporter [Cypionkella sp.]